MSPLRDHIGVVLRLLLAGWVLVSTFCLAGLVLGLSVLFALLDFFSGAAPPPLLAVQVLTIGVVVLHACALGLALALLLRARWSAPAFALWAATGLATALAAAVQDNGSGLHTMGLALLGSIALTGICLRFLEPGVPLGRGWRRRTA